MLAGLFSFLAGCKSPAVKTEGKFKVGQIWKYQNREGEDSSTCTILKIEKYEKCADTIIHVRIDGVNIFSSQSPTGYTHMIQHLPCSEKSISKSVTTIVGTSKALPDFLNGYNSWKNAWDSGKGGYFTVDLKEVVDVVDKGMKEQK
jgi:hypothetical protein